MVAVCVLAAGFLSDAGAAGAGGAVFADLTVTSITTGAAISWSVEPAAVVDGFRVDVTRAGSNVVDVSTVCDGTVRDLRLHALRPAVEHVVTVSAVRAGVVVDEVSATVRPGLSLANVTATPVANGLRVEWSMRAGAVVRGFRAVARDATRTRSTVTAATDEDMRAVVLHGLAPGTRYTVTVSSLFADEPADSLSVAAVPASGAPYWPGWDITRGVALAPGGGGYTLDAWGALHAWADADHPAPAAASRLQYWRGRDVTRGVAILPDGRGGLILDGHGRIHPFGIGAASPSVRGAAVSASDTFRGIAVLPGGTGGYTLEGNGALHPFAIGGGPMPPPARVNVAGPAGPGFARGLTVTPDGRGGYVFDGFGHAFAFSIGTTRPPRPPSGAPTWPFPILRGASTRTTGEGVVLDGFGGVHAFRAARPS